MRCDLTVSRRDLLSATAFLAAAGIFLTAAPATATPLTEGAQALVASFANEGVQLLEDRSAPDAERAERFRALLQKYFAMEAIARWVLGRHYSRLTPKEQQEYFKLFEDLVVYGYTKRFGEYTSEKLRITRTLADSDNRATVFSEIERSGGNQPIHIDWRVGSQGTTFLITDVVVENISLAQTWRSDFSATIQNGGSAASLIPTLRERTQKLKADLGISG